MFIAKIVPLLKEKLRTQGKYWLLVGLALLALSYPLTWISTSFRSLDGWPAVMTVMLLSLALLWLGWKLLAHEQPPAWVWQLMLIAAVARLIAGVLWVSLLPVYGHGNLAEREGYVMGDAFARDKLAWRLARSNDPLPSAFSNNRKVDQYGGLLFVSAFVYRYLGSNFHQPLLMLLLAAAVSALSIPFTWAFARLAWGPGEARLAAWLLALYPEAVLLGSSQMREAFTCTFIIIGLYGVMRYAYYPRRLSLLYILLPLAICVPFSPPAAALMLVAQLLLLGAMRLSRPHSAQINRYLWVGLGALVLLVLGGVYLAMRQFAPPNMVNPFEMLTWYLTKSSQVQGYITQHSSGWVQKVFDSYPAAVRLPVLLAYGVVQPFLPAALIAGSESALWSGIAIWRALGWTFMLAFLLYAPFLSMSKKDGRWFNLAVSFIIWAVVIIASLRGGGDLWDNPRYRAMFAALQAAMMAWAIIEHRRSSDPWMRRALTVSGVVLLWFIPWYLRRYTNFSWPVVDLFKTFGMGLASAFLLILWDWARTASLITPAEAASDPLSVPAAVEVAHDESLV
jgi:hypothetical protein